MENHEVAESKILNERGASMLEYAMMAALIAIVCIAGVTNLGKATSEAFQRAGEFGNIETEPPPPPPPVP